MESFPNIGGWSEWEKSGYFPGRAGGAFANARITDYNAESGGSAGWSNAIGINFSANRDNAIYGRSGTVQPESLKSLYLIKY